MKPEICIRTDGSAKIGLGHVMRCIALAQMLNHYFKISFFCQLIPQNIEYILNNNNLKLVRIINEDEFFNQITVDTLVVLDGYNFDSIYQLKIKSKGATLVCIDDLHAGEFFADLIINHFPSVSAQNYSAQVYTHFALGPDYALLRSPFLEEARKIRQITNIDSVIICFGGSDYNNLTERTLRVVMNYSAFKKIIVIIGHLYNHSADLAAITNVDSRIVLYKGIEAEKIIQLLLLAQLAIVPASGILMEAIAAGNFIISGMYVENQKFVYETLRKEGLFIDGANFLADEIKLAVESVLKGINNSPKIIDGYSRDRIYKKFKQLSLTNKLILRKANVSDLLSTYNWATHPAIRAFSFHNKQIIWEEHVKWFEGKLHDEKCFYFIAELNNKKIGSVRFDIHNHDAIISYLIDHNFHSSGYGLVVLAKSFKLIKEEFTVRSITVHDLVGFVLSNNSPSIKTFINLGFIRNELDGKLKFTKSIYGAIN